MVETTGREDNTAEESMLAILPVCWVLISLLSPTCWLWRRDNDNIAEERMLAILPICCCFLVISLVSHVLAMAEGYDGGWWWRQRDE